MSLNYDDKVLREFGQSEELKPKVIFFSSQSETGRWLLSGWGYDLLRKNKKAGGRSGCQGTESVKGRDITMKGM